MSLGSCGGCKIATNSLSAHDAHRVRTGKHAWTCIPEFLLTTKGLIKVDGVWGFITEEQAEARKARMAAMREARRGPGA